MGVRRNFAITVEARPKRLWSGSIYTAAWMLLLCATATTRAGVLNLVSDPGFEALSGTEPDAATSPWFTDGEDPSFAASVRGVTSSPATQNIRSGANALVFVFYYDAAAVVQNLNAQWSTEQTYTFSAWAMYDDQSGNANHSATPDLNLEVYVSPTLGGTYSLLTSVTTPDPGSSWTEISASISGGDFPTADGQYIQIRLNKYNVNTSHRIFVDDVVFGSPEPPSVGSPTYTAVATNTATLGGTVTVPVDDPATEYGVYWSTTDGFSAPNGTKVAIEGSITSGSFSVMPDSLPAGTVIYFQAFARNGGGTVYSTQASFTTQVDAVTATAAGSVEGTSFSANWQPADGASGYFLDVATDSGFTSMVSGYNNRSVGNVLIYAVSGLSLGQTYYYRVRAQSAQGTGASSAAITVTTANSSLINLVSDPGFEALSGTEPDAATSPWFTDGEDPSFITSVRGVTSSPATQNIRSGANALVFVFYYDAAAVAQNLNTQWSTEQNYTFSAWAMYDDQSGSGAHTATPDLDLEIYVSPTLGGTYTLLTSITAPDPGAGWTQISGSINGADFPAANGQYIQIRLNKDNVNTSHRIFVDDVVFGSPEAPTVVSPTYTAVATNTATLGATLTVPSDSPATEYGVYWSTTDGFSAPNGTKVSVEASTTSGSFSVVPDSLPAGTVIYFQAFARNGGGTVYSTQASFTTQVDAVTATAAGSVTWKSFSANWLAADGASGYVLDVATDSGFTSMLSGYNNRSVGNVLTYPVSGLSLGQTYYYRVRAQSAQGTGASSAGITVTTSDSSITNLLLDPGFEALSGTSPDAATSPWYTEGEDPNASGNPVRGVTSSPVTQNIRSGANALVYVFYYDDAAVVQDLNAQWSTEQNYTFSAWAMYDDQSGSGSHTAPPDLDLEIYVSPTLGGTYTLLTSFTTPDPGTGWTQISASISGADFPAANGQYIQVRLNKYNANTSHRIFVDDVVFGYVEPPTVASPTYTAVATNTATLGATLTVPTDGPATEYGVYWSTTDGFSAPNGTKVSVVGSIASGSFSVNPGGLPAGTVIYFQGFARNGGGTVYSTQASFTTQVDAVTAATAGSVTWGSFSANWQAAAGASGYYLDVATDSGFASMVSGYNNRSLGNVVTFAVTGLSADSTYYYRVRAQSAQGTGASSSTITVTTDSIPAVNLVSDPGFEALSGTSPDGGTSPWFCLGEDAVGSVRGVTSAAVTQNIRSGNNALVYVFYYDSVLVRQDLNTQWSTDQNYTFSVWAMYGDQSGNGTHTATPDLDLEIYVSPTQGGTYTLLTSVATPNPGAGWTQISASINGADFPEANGQYIRIRLNKYNANTSHRIFVDDVFFGYLGAAAIPVLSSISEIATDSFRANWQDMSADSYRLDVSTASDFSTLVSGYENKTVSGTYTTISGLTPGQTYYYRLRSVIGGISSASSSAGTVILPASLQPALREQDTTSTLAVYDVTQGVTYNKYFSDDGGQSWSLIGSEVASGSTMSLMLDEGGSGNRIFTLRPSGITPDETDTTGAPVVVSASINAGSGALTLMSIPVESDADLQGDLGAQLADELGNGAKVYAMSGGATPTWTEFTLNNGTWTRTSGAGSYTLGDGSAFYLQNAGAVSLLRFAGLVGNNGDQAVSLVTGYNLIGIAKGREISAGTAFESAVPVPVGDPGDTSYDATQSDVVYVTRPDGSWRRLIRRANGTWYDTENPNSTGNTGLILQPGQAYYYLRRGGQTTLVY